MADGRGRLWLAVVRAGRAGGVAALAVALATACGAGVRPPVGTAAHEVVPDPAHPGTLTVGDGTYRSRLEPGGVTFDGLRLSLRSVRRGQTERALRLGTWRAEANAATRRVAAGVAEQVTARSGEIEWDVVLSGPPPGRGPLRVEAELGGLSGPPRRDGRSWRLPVAGGDALQLGELVVVDARGVELHRALPRIHGRSLTLDVPAAVLAEAAYPLTLDPTVSNITTVAPNADNYFPSVAFDGTNYLVVWQKLVGSDYDIYGARLDANGTLLNAFPIAATLRQEVTPDVAWDGRQFLVVWESQVSAIDADIAGRWVNPNGTSPGAPFPISTGSWNQRAPAVAAKPDANAGGSVLLVAWHDDRSATTLDIYASRLNVLSGNLDPNGFELSTATGNQFTPDVAWNAGRGIFLAVWRDERFGSGDPDIYGARLYSGGQVLDRVTVGFPVSNPTSAQRDPAVASDGSRFFVTWEDNRTAGNGYDIYGGRVDGDGLTLDGSGFPVSSGPEDQSNPALAYNGTYLVAWRSYTDISVGRVWVIWMARVGGDGRVLDPAGFSYTVYDFHHDNASVVRGPGNRWGLVYDQGAAGISSIHFRTVAPK